MELLSKSNPCGWNLLTIVSRGSSIIAEIQRLSQYIPDDFTFPKSPQANHPYAKILYDFEYFGREIEIDNMIEADPELASLNEECRETHLDTVCRFCRVFESIARYIMDFNNYLEQLSHNYFLQMSIDAMLNETEGKQLLGEAVYLYGVMLLQMDYHIPGLVRERLLVAFNRWRGPSMLLNYSKVCDICRTTDFVKGAPLPLSYPVDYFSRVDIPKDFIQALIGRYRNDDVYMQMPNYPDAEHRSVALGTQARMLFIFLFFAPEMLQDSSFEMREIVDKFFFDNWVVPYFMGYTFELPVVWKPFQAAASAIANTLKTNAMRYFKYNMKKLPELHKKVKDVLSDGFARLELLLDGIDNFVKLVRECNVVLRFSVLHTTAPGKKAVFPLDRDELLAFLLDLAQLEFDLKAALEKALTEKADMFIEERTKTANVLRELALSFSGTLSLSALQKDESLQQWFDNIAGEVDQIENENSVANAQKIFQLIHALEKIMQFSQISQSIVIWTSVVGVIDGLKLIARLLAVDEKYEPLIGTISDFSYGFAILYNFVPLMQKRIKADPFSVVKLRATFMKLSSLLDLQLVRIVQVESNDVGSVSEHYSTTIVDYVRTVLEIVPISIFDVLAQIIDIRTNVLKDLPNRIERAKLKQYAQLEDRERLAKLTKEISILTSGVLAMKTTLMGVITVDPKRMLEEGIRKQLVKKIIDVLYKCLVPKADQGPVNSEKFNKVIESVGKELEGIRHSFEYMGDYVNIDGLRIWHHEYNRVMCFIMEQESNRFLRKKIMVWQSDYQSKVAPIVLPKMNKRFTTCLGKFMNSIIDLTKHSNGATYCGITGGWLNHNTGEEVLGTKTIKNMCNAMGIEGTSSVDYMLSFVLADHLKKFFLAMEKGHFGNFSSLMQNLLGLWPAPPENNEVYTDVLSQVKPHLHEWTTLICNIGQIQLLKATIDGHMTLKCELEAQALHFMLGNANDTVLQAIKQFYRDPTHNPYPSSKLICALSAYLENSGMCEPLEKIYTMSKSLPEVSLVLFGLTLLNLENSKLREDERLHMLVRNDHYGHYEFIVGVITILRQMNVSHTYSYLTFLGQYANLLLANPPSSDSKETTGGISVCRSVKFLMTFVKDYEELARCPRRMVDTFISPTIFDFLSI